MTSYVEFISLLDINNLKNSFLNELKRYNTEAGNCLIKIINKEKVKTKFYVGNLQSSDGENTKCYLIMIVSSIEQLQIKLGKIGFPRGFPIIWIPKKMLNMYGFYPKFENDKLNDQNLNIQNYISPINKDRSELNFNLKYSGFLGQIIPFTYNNNNYWTTTAKNSSNNTFSDNTKRLFEKQMNQKLLETLCKEELHICGEVLCNTDQTHGSKNNEEGVIITCVGHGHWLKKDNEYDIEDEYVDVEKEEYKKTEFIKALNQEEMHKFCKDNGLYVDAIYKIRGEEYILKFINEINNTRNFLTYSTFLTLINRFKEENPNNFEIIDGTINHGKFVGEILEGLINKIKKYSDDIGKYVEITKKVKFGMYVCRTMFFRTFLEKNDLDLLIKRIVSSFILSVCENFEESDEFIHKWIKNNKKYDLEIIVKERFLSSLESQKFDFETLEFINRWIVDVDNQKEIWIDKLNYLKMEIISNYFLHDLRCQYKVKNVGIHILIMDILDIKFRYNLKITKTIENKQDVEKSNINIIFVIGAIGTGKSSIGNILSKYDNKIVHIDGDILDLCRNHVFKLGSERSEYSIWQIIRTLLEGKVPCVSIGGGILLDKKSEVVFIDYLNKIFNYMVSINIILVIPVLEEDECIIVSSDDIESFYNKQIKKIYMDEKRLHDTCVQRDEIHNFSSINARNRSNLAILFKIVVSFKDYLRCIYLTPVVNPINYEKVIERISLNMVGNIRLDSISIIRKPLFEQKRLLVRYLDRHYHVTLEYRKNIIYDENDRIYNIKNKCILITGLERRYIDNILKLLELVNKILSRQYDEYIRSTKLDVESIYNELLIMKDIINSVISNYSLCDMRINISVILKLKGKLKENKLRDEIDNFLKNKHDKIKDFKKIQFIIFQNSETLFEKELKDYAHITINSGDHKASLMKTAANIVYTKLSEVINLPSQTNKEVYSYVYDGGNEVECKLGSIFYI